MRHHKNRPKPDNTTGLPFTDAEINLDVPFQNKEDRGKYVHELWVDQYERVERQQAADAMQQAADMGRELTEREDDELEGMRLSGAVNHVLGTVIPDRAARRFRAGMILKRLREQSHLVYVRHASVTVWPKPSAELAALVNEYAGEIGDILDEQGEYQNVSGKSESPDKFSGNAETRSG